jgi:histidinol phosphatase-like PHP family hydrolase
MLKNGFEKTQEEIFKERAEALGRAGESLSAALRELREIKEKIDSKLEFIRSNNDAVEVTVREINREIDRYNRIREYAKLRYYYLIVIREAVGFRRHKYVEEIYRIPPQKRHLS